MAAPEQQVIGSTKMPTEEVKTSDASAEKNDSKPGGIFNPLDLLKVPDFMKSKTGDSAILSTLSIAGDTLGLTGVKSESAEESKKAEALTVNEVTATRAKALIDTQGSYYYPPSRRLDSADKSALTAGEHKNPDGSTCEVNDQGHVNKLITAATKDHAGGQIYSNIERDAKGDLTSYQTTTGHIFRRQPGSTDANGFSTWSCFDKAGRACKYAGADAHSWKGRPEIDKTGFHNLIASGRFKGHMHGWNSDGSYVHSTPEWGAKSISAINTKVTLADSTQISTRSTFKSGKVEHQQAFSVENADKSKFVVNINAEGKALAAAVKDNLPKAKTSDAKPLVDKETSDALVKKIKDLADPVAELSSVFDKIDNLDAATVTRMSPNKTHIRASLDSSFSTPAPDIKIKGFRPGETHFGDEITCVVSRTEKNGRSEIAISGLTGVKSSITGPIFNKTRDTTPTALKLTRDKDGVPCIETTGKVKLRNRSIESTNKLYEHQMAADSPIRTLLQQPEALSKMSSFLGLFQSNNDFKQFSIKKESADRFDLTTQSEIGKSIEINYVGKSFNVNKLNLGDKLSASFERNTDLENPSVALTKIGGMKVEVQFMGQKLELAPTEIALQNGKDGKPVISISLDNPDKTGKPFSFSLPLATLLDTQKVNHLARR